MAVRKRAGKLKFAVDSNSKMYIEITYKLILQVTSYYNKIYK